MGFKWDELKFRGTSKEIDTIISRLIIIFRGSLSVGYLPTVWRLANVFFFPKPGRAGRINSIRSIFLT